MLENYAFPGALIIGTDSHTPNAGGLGACAVGVGGADAVEVIAGLPWELLYPRRIAVYLTGELSGWTAPKDVILYVAGQLGVSGGTNAIIEYIGPGARTHQRHRQGDDHQHGRRARRHHLAVPRRRAHGALPARHRPRRRSCRWSSAHRDLLAPDPEVEAEPEKHYDRVVELDLSTLEPHVVGPHSPDRARPISRSPPRCAMPRNGFVDAISTALIGSCTNSSYEDMSRAADVARQARRHGAQRAAPLLVTPGSERVRATIERDGQMEALREHRRRPCSPTPAGRASASGGAPSEADGAPNTHRHLLQPQLPAAQRRRSRRR